MNVFISFSKKSFEIKTNLTECDFEDTVVYCTDNIKDKISKIINIKNIDIGDAIKRFEIDYFLVIIWNQHENTLKVYNDFFGSNQIFYFERGDAFYLTNDIFQIPNFYPKIKKQSIYEIVVFQGVLPPDTIFEDIYTIPSGTCLLWKNNTFTLTEYWKVEDYFNKQSSAYESFVKQGREALLHSFKLIKKEDTAIALSGGVDSGGLLGMMTHIHGKGVSTISIGGRGPDTEDLSSARISVDFHKARAQELYPSFLDLKKMPSYLKGLSQPISSSSLFVYSLLHEHAADSKISNIVYGFGAEMLLGNLKLSKIAYFLRWEKYFPKKIRNIFYSIGIKILGLNTTHKEFLYSGDWTERFMYTRGAHYSWERRFFTQNPAVFWSNIKQKVTDHYNKELNDVDLIVKLYIKSWVNYLQMRDISALSYATKTKPIMPFDTIRLLRVFLSVPTDFRKKNHWNKQLIRDIMKPFVPDHLFSNPVRSLIVPYNELFCGYEEKIFKYLKTSPVVSELFDLDSIEKEYDKLPEGGLFLFHILGVALWYDVNFKTEGLDFFELIFKDENK